MRDRVTFWGLFMAGLLVIGIYGWSVMSRPTSAISQEAQTVIETNPDNPVMTITVAGQANGDIQLELLADTAPEHVRRVTELANGGAYDGVVFHRVIDGFMAQSGDVEFGRVNGDTSRAGMGGSDLPDLKSEFSDVPFARGVMGMARSASPHSANSQFFIMFAPAPHLNGQYTVVGRVISGLDVLDAIKRGEGPNGAVIGEPDIMQSVTVAD